MPAISQYGPELWEKARTMVASGIPLVEVAQEMPMTYENLRKRSQRQKWEKGPVNLEFCAQRPAKIAHRNFHGPPKRLMDGKGSATTCHPLYDLWKGMIQRCENPNRIGYSRYGARGIAVCPRWRKSFASFVEDMGPRPEGMTLDRIDPNGDYEPDNCRWTTWAVQANNKASALRRNRQPTIQQAHNA
jgi:hypothetical protein